MTDTNETIEEAWELVEGGLLMRSDFRDFTFLNAAAIRAEAESTLFEGTVVEDAVSNLMS